MLPIDLNNYNTLPLFEEVQPADPASLTRLASLYPIIKKYEMKKQIGFALLHRHFSCIAGSVVVWKTTNQKLFSNIEPLVPSIHVPILWRISETDSLSPLEYLDVTGLPRLIPLSQVTQYVVR